MCHQANTSPSQCVTKPMCHQANVSLSHHITKSMCHQANASTKPMCHQANVSPSQHVTKPMCHQANVSPSHCITKPSRHPTTASPNYCITQLMHHQANAIAKAQTGIHSNLTFIQSVRNLLGPAGCFKAVPPAAFPHSPHCIAYSMKITNNKRWSGAGIRLICTCDISWYTASISLFHFRPVLFLILMVEMQAAVFLLIVIFLSWRLLVALKLSSGPMWIIGFML